MGEHQESQNPSGAAGSDAAFPLPANGSGTDLQQRAGCHRRGVDHGRMERMTPDAVAIDSAGPLEGLRVIDITSTVVGPLATQILGDLGADVIKIEPPGGDALRKLGPARNPGMGSLFLALNRNKRSVVLDLKQEQARQVLERLIEGADVLLHNMRPQAARRLGLSYGDLASRHPRLVYASASGYRSDGPLADRPAFDEVIQAGSGISGLFVRAGDPARYAPFIIADKVVGHILASSVGMALFERERSGRGQEVQVPMLETMVDFNMLEHFWGRAFDPPLGEPGYSRLLTPSRRPSRTADGHVCVTATTDEQWARLFKAIGRPDLAEDSRYSKMEQRSFHFAEIFAQLEEALARKTSAQWMRVFDEHDLPNGPAPSLEEIFDSPYLRDGGVFKHYEHPSEGGLISGQPQVRYSRTPARMHRPPPRLGEHTREVLHALGLDEATMAQIQSQAP